ncbi:MAG: histidine utilization repressor [Gammaproteobacteria bacterium]|nr:histidine utilization repressor [Gammaproteobacteria bacterium]
MSVNLDKEVGPLYQRLKSFIIRQIENGDWLPKHQLPSEHELVADLGVSRMTVNRALRELASDGYLTRVAGVGTFVAELQSRSHFLEIRNIADEVRERMHDYSARVVLNKKEKLSSENALRLQVRQASNAFHSTIVHMENHIPIQLEDRFVNPQVVPGYGSVDFTQTTPAEYLLKVAPLQEVEHTVQARFPAARIRNLLHLEKNEACLVLLRRTWSKGKIASFATLYHPGNRYELSDHFTLR